MRERPGTVQDGVDLFELLGHRVGLAKVENPGGAIQLVGQRLKLVGGTTGEDRPHAAADGLFGNPPTGETVGTVNQPGFVFGHRRVLPSKSTNRPSRVGTSFRVASAAVHFRSCRPAVEW
jgi:hypothetical protein